MSNNKINFKMAKQTVALFFLSTMIVSSVIALPAPSYAQELPSLIPDDSQAEALDINDVLQEIEEAPLTEEAAMPSPPPMDQEITEILPTPVAQEAIVIPEMNALEDPVTSPPQANNGQPGSLPNIPSIRAEDEEEETLFFDAEALVPQTELATKGAPRKVSPATEPGTKLIVVKKNHGKNSKKAEMIAAERAMKLGRYAAALEIYESMYARNKRDPNILMGRAEAYHRLGEDNFAIQAYEELLDIRPNNLQARVNMLGIIGQKYPSVALRQLMDLRQEHGNNVAVVAQIAVTQAKLGEFSDAIRYLGIAASMEPQNPLHIFNMAVIADKSGDKKQAIRFYEQALETDTLYGKGGSIPRDSIFERLASLR